MNISDQAKDDVKALLGDCIVVPLQEHLQAASQSIVDQFGDQLKKSGDTLLGSLGAISGRLEREKTVRERYSESLNEKLDELGSDTKESIRVELQSIQDRFDKEDTQWDEKLAGVQTHLCAQLESREKSLIAKAEVLQDDLTHIQTQLGESRSDLSEARALLTQEFQTSNAGLKAEMERQFSDSGNQLNQELEDLRRKLSSISEAVDHGFSIQSENMTTSFNEMKTAVLSIREDLTEKLGKRYKTLFAISLSFGIANLIGWIAILGYLLMQ